MRVSTMLGWAAFAAVFLAVYGGAHLFFYQRARAAGAWPASWNLILAGFLILMVAAPILQAVLERQGFPAFARGTAWVGFFWMGWIFLWLASEGVLAGLFLLGGWAAKVAPGLEAWLRPAEPWRFLGTVVLATLITGYGVVEAASIRTERITLASRKLPAGLERLRIVQISDVHLGLIVRDRRVERIAAAVRAAEPDLVVSTGDLVDGELDDITCLLQCLRDLKPRFGKWAVTGNHEFFAGADKALGFTRQAGFTVLRGETVRLRPGLSLVGVDDPAGKWTGQAVPQDEGQLLASVPAEDFVLFLKHQPRIAPGSAARFDLQLSGHTHRGQIFPFTLFTYLAYPVGHGLKRLPGGSALYVSRGTGTWGPPLRFLAPPEVTIIEMIRTAPNR